MKMRLNKDKLIRNLKDKGYSDNYMQISWVADVSDGVMVEFEDGKTFGEHGMYSIHKDWCDTIDNTFEVVLRDNNSRIIVRIPYAVKIEVVDNKYVIFDVDDCIYSRNVSASRISVKAGDINE